MIVSMRPTVVAIGVALRRFTGRDARICRIQVLFPDIGQRSQIHRVGLLRYSGESSYVSPQATEKELQLQPGLTAIFERTKDHGYR